MQTNIEILEALLNRNLQSEQTEEINNLPKLNYSGPQISNRIFILDEDETPNMVGYLSPEANKEILSECTLLLQLPKLQIYKLY